MGSVHSGVFYSSKERLVAAKDRARGKNRFGMTEGMKKHVEIMNTAIYYRPSIQRAGMHRSLGPNRANLLRVVDHWGTDRVNTALQLLPHRVETAVTDDAEL